MQRLINALKTGDADEFCQIELSWVLVWWYWVQGVLTLL